MLRVGCREGAPSNVEGELEGGCSGTVEGELEIAATELSNGEGELEGGCTGQC